MLPTAVREKLAVLGGPALRNFPVPVWPPRSQTTAQRLADLYMSGDWSFNLAGQTKEFCKDFAAYHDADHGVLMVNGTVTLLCALAAHGIGAGDEVIVPAVTWPATAMAVKYLGAKIVFADVEPTTLCIDPTKIEALLSQRTRAIIPVHLLGAVADMDVIMSIAKRHDLVVIEDCAQAHGAKWNGRAVGSMGHVGSFSFQQTKIMTSGEGGICITNDRELHSRLYRLSHIGYAPGEAMGHYKSKPDADLVCNNYRCTELQAFLLREQFEQFPKLIDTYNRSLKYLDDRIANIPGVRVQSPGRLTDRRSCFKWTVIFDQEPLNKIPLDVLLKAINAEGVPMSRGYPPVYRHTLFNLPPSDYVIPDEGCKVAEDIAGARAAGLFHQWLGAGDDVLEAIGDVLTKIASNSASLRAMG